MYQRLQQCGDKVDVLNRILALRTRQVRQLQAVCRQKEIELVALRSQPQRKATKRRTAAEIAEARRQEAVEVEEMRVQNGARQDARMQDIIARFAGGRADDPAPFLPPNAFDRNRNGSSSAIVVREPVAAAAAAPRPKKRITPTLVSR